MPAYTLYMRHGLSRMRPCTGALSTKEDGSWTDSAEAPQRQKGLSYNAPGERREVFARQQNLQHETCMHWHPVVAVSHSSRGLHITHCEQMEVGAQIFAAESACDEKQIQDADGLSGTWER